MTTPCRVYLSATVWCGPCQAGRTDDCEQPLGEAPPVPEPSWCILSEPQLITMDEDASPATVKRHLMQALRDALVDINESLEAGEGFSAHGPITVVLRAERSVTRKDQA